MLEQLLSPLACESSQLSTQNALMSSPTASNRIAVKWRFDTQQEASSAQSSADRCIRRRTMAHVSAVASSRNGSHRRANAINAPRRSREGSWLIAVEPLARLTGDDDRDRPRSVAADRVLIAEAAGCHRASRLIRQILLRITSFDRYAGDLPRADGSVDSRRCAGKGRPVGR